MASDSTLKLAFKKRKSVQFWCSIQEEYLQLSEKAKIFLPFLNYIFCEAEFSSYSTSPLSTGDTLQDQNWMPEPWMIPNPIDTGFSPHVHTYDKV